MRKRSRSRSRCDRKHQHKYRRCSDRRSRSPQKRSAVRGRRSKRARVRDHKPLHAYFLMGLPGSGKSTVKRQKIDMKGVVDIDPDRIKKRHPEWRIDNRTSWRTRAIKHGAFDRSKDKRIHKWSVREAVFEFRREMRAARNDVVLDSSGSDSDWLVSRMRRAIDMGYRIVLIYVRIPVEIAVVRNRERMRAALSTSKIPSSLHYVPEDVIWRKAKYMDPSFERAKRFADRWEVVSNYTKEELEQAIDVIDGDEQEPLETPGASSARDSQSRRSRSASEYGSCSLARLDRRSRSVSRSDRRSRTSAETF